jgi:hypothetical protein
MSPLTASLLALTLAVAGCSSAMKNSSGTGGASGEPGEEATGGKGTGGSTGGSPGTGGAVAGTGGATGGNSGGAGSGGSGGADQPDAAIDASSGAADGSTRELGGTLATHPWVIPCEPEWTRAQCCMHYCTCMTTTCAGQAPANCVATCSAPDNKWNLKCRVEQCFEALNPKYPADKGSHCGHAVEKPPKCQGIIP